MPPLCRPGPGEFSRPGCPVIAVHLQGPRQHFEPVQSSPGALCGTGTASLKHLLPAVSAYCTSPEQQAAWETSGQFPPPVPLFPQKGTKGAIGRPGQQLVPLTGSYQPMLPTCLSSADNDFESEHKLLHSLAGTVDFLCSEISSSSLSFPI